MIFSLRGPLKESYQADMDSLNPLLVVVPCLLMAVVAHPSTRHFIFFRVGGPAALQPGCSLAAAQVLVH